MTSQLSRVTHSHQEVMRWVAASDLARGRAETARYKQLSYDLVPRGCCKVLDVGAGTGDDVLAIAERLGATAEIMGLEPLLSLVDEAHQRARNVAFNVRFAVGDARALPFERETFDVVRCDCVLSEIAEGAQAALELLRVLRPGGLLLIHDLESTVLALLQMVELVDNTICGHFAWPTGELLGLSVTVRKRSCVHETECS